jgi:hypothetical protein
VAVLAFGAAPAKAVGPVNTAFGSCIGQDMTQAGGKDCVTAVGHISASVVSTLTINEMRAISFGNFAVNCGAGCAGGANAATIAMDTNGVRTELDGTPDKIILLHGANATPDQAAPGVHGAVASGSQSPGHYTVEADAEGGTTQVYISFADINGNIVDACSPGGPCDDYHNGQAVTITGPTAQTFTVDKFVFNESGSDVYGHYIDNRGGAHNPAPGTSDPFDHTRTAAADVDVVVGATLHTTAQAALTNYAPGKYTGTFDVMVSY